MNETLKNEPIDPNEKGKERVDAWLRSQGLSTRESEIIKLRLGVDESSIFTLEEVGMMFKVNREHIRQIEAKALRKLGGDANQVRETLQGILRGSEQKE
ncbi:hypothetical protein KJ996_05680 [Patescibacteria group bacterium]|nr:hypothetical protein [Patescibacteria group bacterium]